MNKKILAILIIILITGIVVFYLTGNKESANSLGRIIPINNLLKAKPTPSPTPIPIIIDENSNLLEELEDSTPADYSAEFNSLKKGLSD